MWTLIWAAVNCWFLRLLWRTRQQPPYLWGEARNCSNWHKQTCLDPGTKHRCRRRWSTSLRFKQLFRTLWGTSRTLRPFSILSMVAPSDLVPPTTTTYLVNELRIKMCVFFVGMNQTSVKIKSDTFETNKVVLLTCQHVVSVCVGNHEYFIWVAFNRFTYTRFNMKKTMCWKCKQEGIHNNITFLQITQCFNSLSTIAGLAGCKICSALHHQGGTKWTFLQQPVSSW